MPEKGRRGVSLGALLKAAGLIEARILVCQQELEQRIVRTIALLETDSPAAGDRAPGRTTLQADQLILVDPASPLAVGEWTHLLERAADAGCAAVVLPAAAGPSLSLECLQRAEALGLPVLDLPPAVSPAELVSPLVDELLRQEQALLNRTTSVQERMVSQILAGRGGQGIVDLLFTFLGQPILLVDNEGAILGQAGIWHRTLATEILCSQDQLRFALASLAERAGRWSGRENTLELVTAGQECLFARPVIGDDEILGWFILSSGPEALDLGARLALDQAALAAALEMARQAAIRQAEWRLQASLLDDLFRHKGGTSTLETRAQRLGWDLRHKRSVMLVSWDEEEITPQLVRQMEAFVVRLVRAWRPESLALQRESEILILPDLPEAGDAKAAMEVLQGLAQEMLKEWPALLRNVSVVVAIGGVQPSLKEIEVSYHEAQRALAMRRRLGLRHPVVTFQDVWIFSLLERHLDEEEVITLFRRTMGPLAEYDTKHQTELVRTAEVYFDCNYRLQQAADQLLIHPSSLKYRLQRIRDILGSDPFYEKDHLDHYLATKIARLL